MSYELIDKPEVIKGMKFWKNPKNKFPILMLHYSADPDKDPATRKGLDWYNNEKIGTSKDQWDKEYEISFNSKSGKLIYGTDFCDYNPSIGYDNPHWIEPYEWAEPCELIIALDFGQRNPNAALIGVWTKNEELLIVDEYYEPALPSKASKDMFAKFAYLIAPGHEKEFLALDSKDKRGLVNSKFAIKVIDPSTKAKNRSKIIGNEEIPYSVREDFEDHGWEFDLANNDVIAGITRVREYLKIDPTSGMPPLRFFKGKLPNLKREIENYRYKILSEVNSKTHNEPDEPIKKNDHCMDALKYIVTTRPVTPRIGVKPPTRIQKDLNSLLRPKMSAHDWDSN